MDPSHFPLILTLVRGPQNKSVSTEILHSASFLNELKRADQGSSDGQMMLCIMWEIEVGRYPTPALRSGSNILLSLPPQVANYMTL